MNRLLSLALIGFAACAPVAASSPTTTTGGRAATIRPEVNNGEGLEFLVARTESAHVLELPLSAERVWEALATVYERARIPVTDVSAVQRQLGNRGLTLRGRLDGEPLTRFVDCGRVLGGPIANTYRVQLSVLSTVEPGESEGARLVTRVSATARDPGSSSSPVACTSTGELEKRIAALAAVELGR